MLLNCHYFVDVCLDPSKIGSLHLLIELIVSFCYLVVADFGSVEKHGCRGLEELRAYLLVSLAIAHRGLRETSIIYSR